MTAEAPPDLFERVLELSFGLRIGLALAALAGWGLLAVAWTLSPDERGFGTHEQLGLAPCGVATLTGLRCPSCGMTTSWNRLVHGDLIGAIEANAGGVLLGIGWFLAAPWMMLAAVRGRWWGLVPHEKYVLDAALVLLGVTLIDWLARIAWAWATAG